MPAKQIHRWLDDGGAPASEPIELSPPVTWSPQALNARLVAEEALRALPRRPSAITAEARARISRIIAQVEQRQLTLRAATAQLRDLTIRLQQHRRAEEARRRQWRSGRLSHRHA
ncbi:hypothetical protein Q9R08_14870 [Microbacterium sp. QXD-8]|uniref:Transposase n=1 Tax=Microbacterium psychrotolerans TaxID=3068321 RepID=A0ABU0Z5M2_9MICO|nr:hypothetical protein [Microbacterium sp. QXD-8]MDQ7879270.1 hypothetical protein [Microbacterium sp. QXD-8]